MDKMQLNEEVSRTNLTLPTQDQQADIYSSNIPINETDQGKVGNLTEVNQQEQLGQKEEHPDIDSPSSIDLAEKYLSKHYSFRINVILGRLEFKKIGDIAHKSLDDYQFNSLIREMLKARIKITKDTLKSLINSDFAEKYDPFADYFENLPKWDGQTDHIGELASTIKTNDDEKWLIWFKKWIVAVVACAINDSVINHTAIVFAGKQGIGKTTWMKNLVPNSLKDYFYSGIPNLKNKDAKIRMAECLLINLDEMDSLTASNVERLKEIITTTQIKERRPYGYFDSLLPRRASFMGSVNNKQFITDTTGNRRFLCFDVSEINFLHGIDMDLVYAQAKSLLDSGFKYYFTNEENEEISEHNEQFLAISPTEEMILKNFEPVDSMTSKPDHKFTATEIGEYLNSKGNFATTNANIQMIGRIMSKHKFKRTKHQGVYTYELKERRK